MSNLCSRLASVGNPTHELAPLGFSTGVDLYALLDAADLAERLLMPAPPVIDSVSMVGGLAGVFSSFRTRVLDVAGREGVDPRDVFFELGSTG